MSESTAISKERENIESRHLPSWIIQLAIFIDTRAKKLINGRQRRAKGKEEGCCKKGFREVGEWEVFVALVLRQCSAYATLKKIILFLIQGNTQSYARGSWKKINNTSSNKLTISIVCIYTGKQLVHNFEVISSYISSVPLAINIPPMPKLLLFLLYNKPPTVFLYLSKNYISKPKIWITYTHYLLTVQFL